MTALLLSSLIVFAPQDAGAPSLQPPEVEIEVLADVAHVQPGETFHLAVRYTIPKHYHIYWENPGDSGLATEVKVVAPKGYEVGPVRYPAPERFVDENDLVTYVYEKETVLFVPVKASKDAKGEAEFTVSSSWLMCKEACFMGNGEKKIRLAISEDMPKPANDERLSKYRARLPRPWKELRGVEHEWSKEGGDPRLTLRLTGANEVDFFPGPKSPLGVASVEHVGDGDTRELVMGLEPPYGKQDAKTAVQGVLRVVRGEDVRYYDLALAAGD